MLVNLKSVIIFAQLCVLCIGSPVANSCGDTSLGYAYNNETGRCYKFHLHGEEWEAAASTCQQEGASLVFPNDSVENSLLQKMLIGIPIGGIENTRFVGIMPIGLRRGPSGAWLTVDGQTPNTIRWINGFPKEGENYAYMLQCGNVRTFGAEPLAFFCEKPAEKN